MALAVSESTLVIPDGQRLTVTIPWPRHATVTPTGRVSRNKYAGKPIPWLSANVQHNLMSGRPGKPSPPNGRIRVHAYKVQWREAVADLVQHEGIGGPVGHPVRVEVTLYRNPANEMDVGAFAEGAKPLVDGLVQAGLLAGDGPAHLTGLDRGAVLTCKRGMQRVVLRLRAA